VASHAKRWEDDGQMIEKTMEEQKKHLGDGISMEIGHKLSVV
jgi:hypothetical protein